MSAHTRAAGATSRSRTGLRAVPATPGARRSRAAGIALYSAGLVIGFLLSALASAPGGGAVVAWQLALAGLSAAVCAVALMRARDAVRHSGVATPVSASATPRGTTHREYRRAA